jgi:arginine decarboxylase
MTQSTSPQVLIYASIDLARMQMATEGQRLWSVAVDNAERARTQVDAIPGVRCLGHEVLSQPGVASFDPTRLTVTACALGLDGYQLEVRLRDDYRVAVEAADPRSVVLNVTFGDDRADLDTLVAALRDLSARLWREGRDAACAGTGFELPPHQRQLMSPRDAFFAPTEALPIEECLGRIAAEIVTPYPPGIPVVTPGEQVSDELVAWMQTGASTGLHVHGPEDLSLRTLRVVCEPGAPA